MNLNNSQSAAIAHTNGPMLVLAGPGSGKTTVLIHRIINLINACNVPAEKIMSVSFTKASALEMRERFVKACPGSVPVFGTFHSIFFNIIRRSTTSSLSLISEKQKLQFLRTEAAGMKISYNNENEFFQVLSGDISRFINSSASSFTPSIVSMEVFMHFFDAYNCFKKAENLIDFDDMLVKCHDLLSNDPALAKKWQEHFEYILVDEFQDINEVQYETVCLLSKIHRNIFVVGDDDQSIYGFRGANPQIMRRFLSDFPEAKQILLDTNYRCPVPILNASLNVISDNKNRFEKQIISGFTSNSNGAFTVRSFPDLAHEYKHIAGEILALNSTGTPFENIAVLFRNNSDGELFLEFMQHECIPVSSKLAAKNVFNHFIVQDILAYIRLSLNISGFPEERQNFLRIINKPVRFISSQSLARLNSGSCLNAMMAYYKGNQRILNSIGELRNQLFALKSLNPYAAITYICKAIGYESYLVEQAAEKKIDFDKYRSVLNSFLEFSKQFSSCAELINATENTNAETNASENSSGCVKVMTMHASKGLEFEAVFIPDTNENIIPGRHTETPEEIEEERRVFYVAMTRAKRYLRISFVETMHNKKSAPSQLIKKLI